jgi:hypothetical protein
MDSIYRLKNRGVICFLALLLGCFSTAFGLDWRDNYTFLNTWSNDHPLPVSVDVWTGSDWSSMVRDPSTYNSYYAYDVSNTVSSPMCFRINNADSSSYVLDIPNDVGNSCFVYALDTGYVSSRASFNDTANQTVLTDLCTIRSGDYIPPHIVDLGFSLQSFIDALIIALGVTVGIVVGGIVLFMFIRRGLQHMRGLG